MPFTLAHPAAVLPLRRTKLVFSALVIGSMTPDLPYFLTLEDGIRFGHTWRGIFLFCMPAGLAMLWIFHAVLKRPLVSLAPEFMRRRISERSLAFSFGPAPRFLLILGSLLLGTLTHILWDGFTHENGYFVKHWAVLHSPVMLYRVMPLWKALQAVCSAAGCGLVIAVAMLWWYQMPEVDEPVTPTFGAKSRWTILAIGVLIPTLAGLAGSWPFWRFNWKDAITHLVIAGIAATFAEIVLFSLAWRACHKSEKPLDSDVQRLNVPVER